METGEKVTLLRHLSSFRTIEWRGDRVAILDQRLLPTSEVYRELCTPEDVAEAIKCLMIRGAPAIGIAGAMGLALAALGFPGKSTDELLAHLRTKAKMLLSTRPTAVNLAWALKRCLKRATELTCASVGDIQEALISEAQEIFFEDLRANITMGRYGAELVPERARILTHCNAGGLATSGYGTALGVIRWAYRQGKVAMVLADETRPFLQGARLTAWELLKEGIPVTVITDNMAGHFMKMGEVDLIIVGADRIAANGDVANKIGTYSLAVLAKEHGIPFYVAAPLSTFDPATPFGDGIPIEERDPEDVVSVAGTRVAPQGVLARYPAFDVTPAGLISAIITEKGVLRPPLHEAIEHLLGETQMAGGQGGLFLD